MEWSSSDAQFISCMLPVAIIMKKSSDLRIDSKLKLLLLFLFKPLFFFINSILFSELNINQALASSPLLSIF
ncbi:hypothetical protein OIU77_000754 [Salix suchowensis]|uniref:Uncharacterized protein n=1 Tax=Salix suchowensis TaxID=1278906 RepID=A0ABQ9B9N6_9ROSI|nr:hypothetical protein OIU77_000754 [Salix suchowensis]